MVHVPKVLAPGGLQQPRSASSDLNVLSRRHLLRWGMVGSGILLPPAVQTFSEIFDEDAALVRRLVYGMNGPYAANGQLFMFIATLIGMVASLIQIFEFFGARKSDSRTVVYVIDNRTYDAFRAHEAQMRAQGCDQFTGVTLARYDQQIALLGGHSSNYAAAAFQYGNAASVGISGPAVQVLHAGASYAHQRFNLDDSHLAQATSIVETERRVVRSSYEDVAINVYHNACGGYFMHDPRPARDCGAGQLAVHLPPYTTKATAPIIGLRTA